MAKESVRRKGYFFDKKKKKWRVLFYFNKKKISLGYFDTELEAKLACDKERESIQKSLFPYDITEYRDIPDYNGKYKISKDGKILSMIRTEITEIRLTKNVAGYLSVILTGDDGSRKRFLIHKILYSAFVGPVTKNMDVDHIDRDISNNNISNLRLLTRAQNIYNSKRMDDAKGYTYDKKRGLWVAQIKVAQKNNYLGSFQTKEEARSAYLEALDSCVVMPE